MIVVLENGPLTEATLRSARTAMPDAEIARDGEHTSPDELHVAYADRGATLYAVRGGALVLRDFRGINLLHGASFATPVRYLGAVALPGVRAYRELGIDVGANRTNAFMAMDLSRPLDVTDWRCIEAGVYACDDPGCEVFGRGSDALWRAHEAALGCVIDYADVLLDQDAGALRCVAAPLEVYAPYLDGLDDAAMQVVSRNIARARFTAPLRQFMEPSERWCADLAA